MGLTTSPLAFQGSGKASCKLKNKPFNAAHPSGLRIDGQRPLGPACQTSKAAGCASGPLSRLQPQRSAVLNPTPPKRRDCNTDESEERELTHERKNTAASLETRDLIFFHRFDILVRLETSCQSRRLDMAPANLDRLPETKAGQFTFLSHLSLFSFHHLDLQNAWSRLGAVQQL